MNDIQKKCCEKCIGRPYLGLEKVKCWDKSCSCHSPQPQQEGWESEFRRLFGALGGKTGLVIDHISTLLTSARRDDLEWVEKAYLTMPHPEFHEALKKAIASLSK